MVDLQLFNCMPSFNFLGLKEGDTSRLGGNTNRVKAEVLGEHESLGGVFIPGFIPLFLSLGG